MARIQDVINNLDPDTASQVIEALRNPGATAEGILSAIRNFDVSDATDAVKSFIEEKTTPSNIISQAGDFALEQANLPIGMSDLEQVAGGDMSGILSQAGDFILDQTNLPINMSDVQNIASAAKSEGITGAIGVGADIALDAIKNFGVEEGIKFAINRGVPITTIVQLSNLPGVGPEIRKFGGEFRNLGSSIFGARFSPTRILGINEPFGKALDFGLDVLGIGKKEEEDEDPPPPVGGINIPNVIQTGGSDDQIILTGGTADSSDDITVSNLAPIQPTGGGQDSSQPDFPTGRGNVVTSGFRPPSTNVQQETQRISDIMDRRRRGFSQGFNAGGLASIPKYLKGR